MTFPDTSAKRVNGYANWHEREARSLRLHRADSPLMPELAEMHEETAATLRALAAENARLRAALEQIAESDEGGASLSWHINSVFVVKIARAALTGDADNG